MNKLDKLMERMIEFDGGDPKRIQHYLKVHSFEQKIRVAKQQQNMVDVMAGFRSRRDQSLPKKY